ncbi:MAG: ADP-heptose:LPS heptosyltransferase [Saprospiraceae bacterium]|jgi:ADP-heptose:LPS heptosyltransferase
MSKQVKILVLRFSSIGDIVLTSPVVRNLKKQIDNVALHYLTKTTFRGLLMHNPYVDKVWSFNKDLDEVLPDLLNEKFDYVVDLHKNLRTLRLKKSLKVKALSFDKQNINKFLLAKLKINRMPGAHIVDRYMACVRSLGVVNDKEGLDFFTNPESENIFVELSNKLPEKYTVVVVGAAHFTKVPTVQKYREILEAVDRTFVLVGGERDCANAQAIEDQTNVVIHNYCGKTTLDTSAMLIKNAELVITPDTGMMHVAAAYKIPIVSLWGNTVPEFGMTPYYGINKVSNLISEVKGLSCRPCSKIGYDSCPKGHFKCVKHIEVNQIQKWVGEI